MLFHASGAFLFGVVRHRSATKLSEFLPPLIPSLLIAFGTKLPPTAHAFSAVLANGLPYRKSQLNRNGLLVWKMDQPRREPRREAIVSRMIGICIFYNRYVENTMHLF